MFFEVIYFEKKKGRKWEKVVFTFKATQGTECWQAWNFQFCDRKVLCTFLRVSFMLRRCTHDSKLVSTCIPVSPLPSAWNKRTTSSLRSVAYHSAECAHVFGLSLIAMREAAPGRRNAHAIVLFTVIIANTRLLATRWGANNIFWRVDTCTQLSTRSD